MSGAQISHRIPGLLDFHQDFLPGALRDRKRTIDDRNKMMNITQHCVIMGV